MFSIIPIRKALCQIKQGKTICQQQLISKLYFFFAKQKKEQPADGCSSSKREGISFWG